MKSMHPAAFRTVLLAACLVGLTAPCALADPYEDLVTYTVADSRSTLAAIEADVRAATTAAKQHAIEIKLLNAICQPKATHDAKVFACRCFRQIGSKRCVPILARFLADKQLSHMARYALQNLPVPEAGAALLAAAKEAKGDLKIGMISSLGRRKEAAATKYIASLLAERDAALQRSAILALARIASPAACDALQKATVPAARKPALADAILQCADAMLAAGQAERAAGVYESIYRGVVPMPVRIAALRGVVMARKEKAVGELVTLAGSKDLDLSRAAARFMMELPGPAATRAIAAELDGLTPARQVVLIAALAERADKAAAPAVTKLVGNSNADVRLAAIRALAVLGDAASVPILARTAAGSDEAAKEAVASLTQIKGEGVGEAMARLLDGADASTKAGILRVLTARGDRTAAPALLKAAASDDATLRAAALGGLPAVVGPEHTAAVIELLLKAKDDGARRDLLKAVSAAAGRSEDIEARTAPIIAALPKADQPSAVGLISVLGRLGGGKALAALRACLQSSDSEKVTQAVRALAAWSDAAPADDLLGIAKTGTSQVQKVLAFRGYVRMASTAPNLTGTQRTAMYKQAVALATTPDAKRSLLSGLAQGRSPEAMRLAEGMLADSAVRGEAELALLQIAGNARDAAPGEARAAARKLASSAQSDNVRKGAVQLLSDMDRYRGYVTSWLGAGPYEGKGLDSVLPPEKPGSGKVAWKPLTKGVGPQIIDLLKAVSGGSNRVAYAKTGIYSAKDREVVLEIGSDDGVKVWVNGKLVHRNPAVRPIRPGEDKPKARLKKGWNALLVKVQQGGGDWGFCLRIVQTDGQVPEDLRVSPEGR